VDGGLELLLLKVAIAPVFIGLVSWVSLRYGHRAAGWLVALPVNTGTILFVLTLSNGPGFAAPAAFGALLGIVSLCAFALAYARSATHLVWPICLTVATAAFALSTWVLIVVPGEVVLDLVIAVAAIGVVIWLIPSPTEPAEPGPSPRWEIPLRMLTAAALVLTITTAAGALGPRLSGLLSPVPVFTITLVVFTHSRHGPGPVFVFLNGLQYGLFSFAAFCAVVGILLGPLGLVLAIVAGLAAFLAVYGLVRVVFERLPRRPFAPEEPAR